MIHYGKTVKFIRTQLNMSAKELSSNLPTKINISKIENSQNQINVNTLELICKALNMQVSKFIEIGEKIAEIKIQQK